jgi:hypothetical protein
LQISFALGFAQLTEAPTSSSATTRKSSQSEFVLVWTRTGEADDVLVEARVEADGLITGEGESEQARVKSSLHPAEKTFLLLSGVSLSSSDHKSPTAKAKP